MLISFLLCIIFCRQLSSYSHNILFVILGQASKYDTEWSLSLVESIVDQNVQILNEQNQDKDFYKSAESPLFLHLNGSESPCYWQILSLSQRLLQDLKLKDKEWFVFLEAYSNVRVAELQKYLETQNATEQAFIGYGMRDLRMTITHHYYGFYNDNDPPFYYPDISAGLVLSRPLLQKIYEGIEKGQRSIPQFTIDSSHELARFVFEHAGVRLTNREDLFCLKDTGSCAVYYTEPRYECESQGAITTKHVKAYVKTWSGNHQKRLPYIIHTWGKLIDNIEYISNEDSEEPLTRSLGVKNTERGHCGKTFAILQKYNEEDNDLYPWLLIADDDSLINTEALVALLSCYDPADPIVLGERYGFGASLSGRGSYNYPTGGAGMVFSKEAVKSLVKTCSCPNVDSPDDMIIGMCSMAQDIPIIHSPAFHQAQPWDYPEFYRNKIWPISYHKFFDSNPMEIYEQHVKLERPTRPDDYVERKPRHRWFTWDDVKISSGQTNGDHFEL